MKFHRDVYRWGLVDSKNDEIEVEHGLVEVIYKDGTVAEIDVESVDHLVIHHRIPDEVKTLPPSDEEYARRDPGRHVLGIVREPPEPIEED